MSQCVCVCVCRVCAGCVIKNPARWGGSESQFEAVDFRVFINRFTGAKYPFMFPLKNSQSQCLTKETIECFLVLNAKMFLFETFCRFHLARWTKTFLFAFHPVRFFPTCPCKFYIIKGILCDRVFFGGCILL